MASGASGRPASSARLSSGSHELQPSAEAGQEFAASACEFLHDGLVGEVLRVPVEHAALDTGRGTAEALHDRRVHERILWREAVFGLAVERLGDDLGIMMFATDSWMRPGAVFFLWVATSHRPAIAVSAVAEPVRDLNIYRGWLPFQPEGEVTAKVHIPATQIEKMEWWTPDGQGGGKLDCVRKNPNYVRPEVLSDVRGLF